MTTVPYDTWKQIDLRVGTILEIEDHPKADRLYVLRIDLGSEQRTLVAGLKEHYTQEQLVGKKVVVFTNLEPKELRGITSQGMVLAAVDDANHHVFVITPDNDIANGSVIR